MTDKEKVIKELRKLHGSKETIKLISDTIKLLEEQQETGCWVHGHCSCCGEDIGSKLDTWTNIQQFLFCPKCGAKMLEDE